MSCSPRELPPRCDPYLYLCREIPVFGQRVRLLKAGLFIYNLYHTAGRKGQAQGGGKKSLGRRARRRRKKREPGRGHKDRPAIIAWGRRQGAVVLHATRAFTVKTVQQAATIAVHVGGRLYTDSASSYRALKGYVHACEQAELILQAALDPAIARRAKKGEWVTYFDHFDLLQTAIN